uniref:Uncharacterized protein n=1 Tax=Ditylenchus dipsaci TaxID=166011 RepID=A0A915DMI2_9BILA
MDSYKLAILFGTESMLDLLLPKLEEISTGSHLIMCRFPLPMNRIESPQSKWKLLEEEGDGIDAAWLYRKKSINN